MTHIPIMVRVIDEVVPDASLDRQLNNKVISYCFECGGIVFYQIVEFNYEETEHATDTCVYCAQCGQLQGGIINDPFDEIPPPKSVSATEVFQSLSEKAKTEVDE